ncbi:MAG: hypothetical protein IJP92_06440, partial [Lachnospiraceae bacterium]|nr:hypothetical protein [Lachnospiraceae bacterium]
TYCGSAAVFESRISEEKEPDYIIPFQKTKEDCIKEYRKRLRRAIYAPAGMRDPAFLDRFTGVYVPYWVYETEMEASPQLTGTEEYRSGDYLHYKTYTLTADVKGQYAVNFDASSFFHDETATAISPFAKDGIKPFHPAMLSGFFADTADVDAATYLQEAKNRIGEDAYLKLVSRNFHGISPSVPYGKSEMDRMFSLNKVKAKRALFPVWFLTWRNKDRVAYAAMNAQTGKLAADIPIDPKRFLLGSLLLAVPFFFLYRMLLTVTAPVALLVTFLAGCLFLFLYIKAGLRYCETERYEPDIGVLARRHADRGGKADTRPVSEEYRPPEPPGGLLNRGNTLRGLDRLGIGAAGRTFFGIGVGLLMYLVLQGLVPALERRARYNRGRPSSSALNAVSIVGIGKFAGVVAFLLICAALIRLLWKSVRAGTMRPVLYGFPAFAGMIAAAVVLVMAPVSDLPYYLAVIGVLAGEVLTFLGLIAVYNRLVTREAPHFHQREGGDQLAP